MAGHSKWANIQHRKGVQDAKRGKLFSKMIREITVAARMGGVDPGSNSRLRTVMDKALAANMTRDTIDRAIKRGAGALDGAHLEEVSYEGYGPGGVAVLVECLTDNRNRTVGDVRHAFSKCGGNLGTEGSVAYLFTKQGVLYFAPGAPEDRILEAALEAGALDVVTDGEGGIEVLTASGDFLAVKDALSGANLVPTEAEITQRATTTAALSPDDARKMLKMNDMLEDLDDVQNVYSNAELPDAVMAEIA